MTDVREDVEVLRNFAEACCGIIEHSRFPVEEITKRLDDVRDIVCSASASGIQSLPESGDPDCWAGSRTSGDVPKGNDGVPGADLSMREDVETVRAALDKSDFHYGNIALHDGARAALDRLSAAYQELKDENERLKEEARAGK